MIKRTLTAALVISTIGCGTVSTGGKGAGLLETTKTPNKIYCATNNKEALHLFSKATSIHNNPTQAKELYQKAITIDPGFCDAMDNLGVLYRAGGDFAEAEYWYRKSIETNQKNPVPHINLGVIYLKRGEYDKARIEYQAAADIEPANPEGYYSVGLAYVQMKRYEDAIPFLEKSRELYSPTQADLISHADYLLGLSNAGAGHWDKAEGYLERAYPYFENDPQMNYLLGLSYYAAEPKDLVQAKKYLRRSNELGHPAAGLLLSTIESNQK